MLIDIRKIKVSDRIRKDFGNIEELAEDIKLNGLINPPVVTPEYELIAGERRLRACKHLGFQQIEVRIMTVTDFEHQLKLEISENEHRKEFTFSERVEWAKRLEQVEKLKAKERMAGKENLPDHESGQVRDIVAEQAGFGSGKQYDKAKFIAENATPEIIQQLDDGIISTHRAFIETKERLESELRAAEERAELAEQEADKLKRQFKNAVPAEQVEEAVSAAVERHQEETAVFIREKESEAETRLKQQEKLWKAKLDEELQNERLKMEHLRSGYQRAKEELETLKLQQPAEFDEQMAEAQMKKLRFEADNSTIQVSIHIKQFLQKVGITSFMLGAVANASSSEKKRLLESLDMLQTFIDQIKPAVNGRKVV
ncbi:ParB N-terminal domain-containing protein [Paenibacillus thermotolerans]|uniref:ParB N-terminal domain-containing protein n=1 Tax=Paenibacillus thermotolerans TaxID=3027807 RepID=UPI0023677F1E|nr:MULTISPECIES: ParB N-terminal domain-containing protein [unclassified Paenibacillus]